MSASAIVPTTGFVEPAEDLSSDPITVAMLRMYRASSPSWRRAFSRMLESIAGAMASHHRWLVVAGSAYSSRHECV